jgi:hypothetical protein
MGPFTVIEITKLLIRRVKNLIELYEAWEKPEKAEEWRVKLQRTEAMNE